MVQYDFIILGAGASGLMIASAMARDPWFDTYKILLIDKDLKTGDDRTWCFWENGSGVFDQLLSRQWDHIYFKGPNFDSKLPIQPYSYKMLRSGEFYKEMFSMIGRSENIDFLQADVQDFKEVKDGVQVQISGQQPVLGHFLLNSLFDYKSILHQQKYPVLQQHFIGWFVESKLPVFDENAATFMDFSIPQKGNTRFMYILPFSKHTALVEYTLFSGSPLEESEYEEAIKEYLQHRLNISEYTILEKEKGNIPMTCYDFEDWNSDRIIHIGTAGGWAKPSTGYTFKNSYRNSQKLVDHIKSGNSFKKFTVKSKFWKYDLLLLDILDKHNELGSVIFESMFKKRKPELILKFLDEKTSLLEDLRVITACPMLPFIRALWARIFSSRPERA